jgi:hypothetical protein
VPSVTTHQATPVKLLVKAELYSCHAVAGGSQGQSRQEGRHWKTPSLVTATGQRQRVDELGVVQLHVHTRSRPAACSLKCQDQESTGSNT